MSCSTFRSSHTVPSSVCCCRGTRHPAYRMHHCPTASVRCSAHIRLVGYEAGCSRFGTGASSRSGPQPVVQPVVPSTWRSWRPGLRRSGRVRRSLLLLLLMLRPLMAVVGGGNWWRSRVILLGAGQSTCCCGASGAAACRAPWRCRIIDGMDKHRHQACTLDPSEGLLTGMAVSPAPGSQQPDPCVRRVQRRVQRRKAVARRTGMEYVQSVPLKYYSFDLQSRLRHNCMCCSPPS